jgi:hypothetical protein
MNVLSGQIQYGILKHNIYPKDMACQKFCRLHLLLAPPPKRFVVCSYFSRLLKYLKNNIKFVLQNMKLILSSY